LTPRVRAAWRVVFASALLVCALVVAVGLGHLAAFTLLWGFGVGGACWRWHAQVRAALGRARLLNLGGFLAVVAAVSVAEETVCAGFGCTLAVPDYAADLFVVVSLWLAWMAGWWLFVAPRFAFAYEEALLCASLTGVLFEVVGNARAWADPWGSALASPLAVVVYMGISALPLSMVTFTGTRSGPSKFLVGVFVPWFFALAAAIPVFIAATALGLLPP
jgi:hypothetical protein